MPAINLVNISFSYATVPVLNDVSLHVSDGERACLVGPNGCGKTTLLRIASGDLPAQRGKVEGTQSERFRVPSIEQFDGSVGDYLDAALRPLRTIAGQFAEVTVRIGEGGALGEWEREYDQLLAQMTSFDIWSLDARVAEVLAGLGLISFTRSGRNRELSRLSPGQRGRLQLAATLILKPAVLILDEPTNHLDAQALSFLTQTVNSWAVRS